MKFLILTQFFPHENGAAQTRLAATALALKESGHEVEIVTALPNYPLGQIFEGYKARFYMRETWQGLTVHRFWIFAGQGKALLRLLNYLSFAFTACFAIFVAPRPDFIFVNSGP